MYNVWYFRTYPTIYSMLLALFFYVFFAVLVGTLGSDRKLGFFPAFTFSLILTPVVGWLITLAYPVTETNDDPAYNDNLRYAMKAYHKGNMEEAYRRVKSAILMAPDNPEAYLRLGAYYAKDENIPLAIKNVAKAKSLGIPSLELLDKEPFDAIRSSKEWKEFKANDYETDKPIIDKPVSSTDELLKLGELLEKGLITREEFDAQKSKLLK